MKWSKAHGYNLYRLRLAAGLPSMERLAKKARLNVATISKLERGLQTPNTHTVESLAFVFGLTISQLKYRLETGQPAPSRPSHPPFNSRPVAVQALASWLEHCLAFGLLTTPESQAGEQLLNLFRGL